MQDPVVHHNFSPYSAFDNNPVYWADSSGADSTDTQRDVLGREKYDEWNNYIPVGDREDDGLGMDSDRSDSARGLGGDNSNNGDGDGDGGQGQPPSPNKKRAQQIVNLYGRGDVDEITAWLDEHPFVVVNGEVQFKGIDNLSIKIKAEGNSSLDKSIKKATLKAIPYMASRLLKTIFGVGSLASTTSINMQPTDLDKNRNKYYLIFSTQLAEQKLLSKMFEPQGLQLKPELKNGYNKYSGYNMFDLFYKWK